MIGRPNHSPKAAQNATFQEPEIGSKLLGTTGAEKALLRYFIISIWSWLSTHM